MSVSTAQGADRTTSGTLRYRPTPSVAEDALTAAIVALASHYGRDGYRRVTALLNQAGLMPNGGGF